jgi:hypothetical protein
MSTPEPELPGNQLGIDEYKQALELWQARRELPLLSISGYMEKGSPELALAAQFLIDVTLNGTYPFNFEGSTYDNAKQLREGMTEKFERQYRFHWPQTKEGKKAFATSIQQSVIPEFLKEFRTGEQNDVFVSSQCSSLLTVIHYSCSPAYPRTGSGGQKRQ